MSIIAPWEDPEPIAPLVSIEFIRIRRECAENMLSVFEALLKSSSGPEVDWINGVQLLHDIENEFMSGGVWEFSFPHGGMSAKRVLPYYQKRRIINARSSIDKFESEKTEASVRSCAHIKEIYMAAANFQLEKIEEVIQDKPRICTDEEGGRRFMCSVVNKLAHALGYHALFFSCADLTPEPSHPVERIGAVLGKFRLQRMQAAP